MRIKHRAAVFHDQARHFAKRIERSNINADITAGLDTTGKRFLSANAKLSFMGTTKVGDFDIPQDQAIALLRAVNPHGNEGMRIVNEYGSAANGHAF